MRMALDFSLSNGVSPPGLPFHGVLDAVGLTPCSTLMPSRVHHVKMSFRADTPTDMEKLDGFKTTVALDSRSVCGIMSYVMPL